MRVAKAALSAAAAAGLGLVLFAGSHAQAGILFQDTFSYPDGPLVTVAAPTWVTHSGTAGQVDVTGGVVNLTFAESEDVSAAYTPVSSGLVYFGFDVTMSVLPSTSGSYFVHLKDAGTSNFRARVYANTTGAAPGTYRLGIANGSGTAVFLPTDLNLNEWHRVVVRYNVDTMVATLFLDSPTETGGLDGTDSTTYLVVSTIALRQASGIGTSQIDNLVVGTSYAEVAPEPASVMVLAIGAGMLAMRRRR